MTHHQFISTVWNFYLAHRRVLPWRPLRMSASRKWGSQHSYKIVVSEIMLQQTQVDRVIPLFNNFLEKFPSWEHLASATLRDVLLAWKGLGYNRRARYLHECAKSVIARGSFPQTHHDLLVLPGIGPYTAGMLMNTVLNIPHPIIETNIRTVYLHHFFKNKKAVTDIDIMKKIEVTLSSGCNQQNSREWQYALMDYGSYIKKTFGNNNATQSAHHTRQSTFKGSRRELRSAILHAVSASKSKISLQKLRAQQEGHPRIADFDSILESLLNEGMIMKKGQSLSIA
jgi:A/G-specific adenine glycosylase